MATVKTNVGTEQMILLVKNSLTAFIGWGTGAGTSSVTDTTLFTETTAERTSAATSLVTTTLANDTLQATAVLTSVSGETITNAGLFDAASGGNLYVKGDFSGIVLNSSDQISFTINLQQT
jgi:hypothetical protein